MVNVLMAVPRICVEDVDSWGRADIWREVTVRNFESNTILRLNERVKCYMSIAPRYEPMQDGQASNSETFE
jgi:hypothetical protein